jgi:hypothetical protein
MGQHTNFGMFAQVSRDNLEQDVPRCRRSYTRGTLLADAANAISLACHYSYDRRSRLLCSHGHDDLVGHRENTVHMVSGIELGAGLRRTVP